MELTNYNLESGSKVRLFYKDGRQKLVSRTELTQHLAPLDVERVQNAFHLRQVYFRELPKWVKMMIIPVLVFGLGFQGVKAAPGIQRVLHTIIPAIPAPVQAVPTTRPEPVSVPVVPTPAQPAPAETELPANAGNKADPIINPVTKGLVPGRRANVPRDVRAVLNAHARVLQNLTRQ